MTPVRKPTLAVFILLALTVCAHGLKGQACPVPLVMDGHTHMGFATAPSGEVAVASLDYIAERGYRAVGFVMPVDRRDATDLPATLADEISQLKALSSELGTFALTRTPAEVMQACEEGKMAVLPTLEYLDGVFGTEPERVDRYAEMGILSITLVNNEFDRLLDRHERTADLTPMGRDVVSRMNANGILVDITHLWPQDMLAVVAASDQPVIASHSNPQGAGAPDSPLFDQVVQAMADKGGLVMLSFNASRLFHEDEDQIGAIDRLLDQMDHIRNLVGIDHVGIGTDLQAFGQYVPDELGRTSTISDLQAAMATRRYRSADIQKVLSGNFLRLLAEIDTRAQPR